ncbi:MAG: TIGR02099 family protein [Nevskia sp.]|nr:TIGR02099 family protein [Nevskia sp.]
MERRRRRWWTLGSTVVAVLVIAAASLSLSFRFAFNTVPAYRARVQSWASQALGRPTRLGSIAMTWRGLRPSLDLSDIEVLDDQGAVQARAARLRLGFSLGRLLAGRLAPDVAELYGVVLQADADAQGHWSLRGFGEGRTSQDRGALLRQLAGFALVRLVHGEAVLYDPAISDAPLRVTLPRAELRHSEHAYSLQAALTAPAQIGGDGRIEARFDGDPARPDDWNGTWKLDFGGFSGWPGLRAALAPDVGLDLRGARLNLSGVVRGSRPESAGIGLLADSVSALRGGRPAARFERPQLQAQARYQAGDWHVQISRLAYVNGAGEDISSRGTLDLHSTAGGRACDLALERLRLDDLAPWLAVLRGVPARAADLGGELRDLSLHAGPGAAAGQGFQASARLLGVALRSRADEPGFSGLDGLLRFDPAAVHLQLRQASPRLDLPELFAAAVPIDSLNADVDAAAGAAGWRISAAKFDWKALGARGGGQLDLLLPASAAQSPSLRLLAEFSAADVGALKPYMPRHWGAGTREWLSRALQGGSIDNGQLQLDGPLGDFPFVEHPGGTWALDFDVVDTRLDYARNWPGLEHLRAALKFRGHGLQIAGVGRIGSTRVDRVAGQIADLRQASLTVDGGTHGDAAGYYAFLRASPLSRKLAGLLERTDASGPADVDIHLQIPLQQDDPDVSFSGRARFDGGDLRIGGIGQPVHGLRGTVQFGDRGVRAERLAGQLYGTALDATVRGEGDSPDGVVRIGFAAPAEPSDGLLAAFVPDWLRLHLHGSSRWSARLPLAGARSGQLALETDLRGIASDLPAPLGKAAEEALPVSVGVSGGTAGAGGETPLRVSVQAGDRLRLALRFAQKGAAAPLRAADVRLGAGPMPRADEDGLRIGGEVADLDFGAWLDLFGGVGIGGGEDGGALAFRGADLTAQRLIYGGFAVRPVHLAATPAAGGWSIRADGPGAAGTVEWSAAGGGSIRADLQHLGLDAMPAPAAAPDRHARPFDPSQAPVLDFSSESMQVGEADLGRVSVRTQRIAGGQSLQQLSVQGRQIVASASGQWTRQDQVSAARLEYSSTIRDAGEVLRGFGYAENLDAGKADFSGRLAWPGAADGLELAQAAGSVSLKVGKGTLREVNPGAGRVLGLLNLYALPRRLTFDFHDVVSKGLGFDSLSGTFTLTDGQARTEDMKIVAPSMRMEVRGRIGLAARDYDQRVTVYPDVSTSVAVGATLIGGPIAGGVALLAQEIFNKPFNQIGRFSYHVSGTWDNPQVNAEGKEDAPAAPEHKPAAPARPPADDQGAARAPGKPT